MRKFTFTFTLSKAAFPKFCFTLECYASWKDKRLSEGWKWIEMGQVAPNNWNPTTRLHDVNTHKDTLSHQRQWEAWIFLLPNWTLLRERHRQSLCSNDVVRSTASSPAIDHTLCTSHYYPTQRQPWTNQKRSHNFPSITSTAKENFLQYFALNKPRLFVKVSVIN
jgi:hypothetical protein